MGEQPANAVKAAEEKLHDEQLDWEDFCADKAELEEPVDESDRWVNIQRWVIEDLLDAARTEGRGAGEPVASDKALFDALWELVAAMANEGIPQTPRTKAAFKVAHQAALDRLRKDWSSPIREPEISRTKRDEIEKLLRDNLPATCGLHCQREQTQEEEDATYRETADAILNLAPVGGRGATYQARVDEWVLACFGEEVARDVRERNHRFLEESLELVQSNGCTASEAHQLVDYVFGRPVGEPGQEVGGVMNTLAALCNAAGLDLNGEAERELARVWTKVEQIRAKHASKPKHSPLPGAAEPPCLRCSPPCGMCPRELSRLRSNEESQTNGS